MGYIDSFLILCAFISVPYFVPMIIGWFGFGLFGENVATYAIPFLLHWILNTLSNYLYYYFNCKGTRTVTIMTVALMSVIPGIIAGGLNFALNFVPVLKTPLLFLTIFGGMWMVTAAIDILAMYGLAFPMTMGTRTTLLNSCKKEDKKEENK